MAVELQFVREAALSSDAIAWFSAGHFSHVDARLACWLLGARSDRAAGCSPGVCFRPSDYAPFALTTRFQLPATSAQEARWREFLHAQVGKPYDWQAIWAFAVNRDWRAPDSWICSELQAAALEYAGIVPPLYLAANKITPVALALAISAAGAQVIT